jgi:hypothetical protein
MFEDDEDDDFERSEFDIWYDDNFRYFRRGAEKFIEPSLDVELFYKGVYCPVMKELGKEVYALALKHYPIIGTEQRPAVLEAIRWRVEITGHEFLLRLYDLVQDQLEGINLHEKHPELDEWAVKYPTYRKPHYLDQSFFDKFTWLTEEQKQEMIAEDKKDADETFQIKEKPRFEFFDLLQRITFKYFKGAQDLDTDGWVVYNVILFSEYTDYEIRFEYIDEFIDYEFDEEDLNIPYAEFSKKLYERFSERRESEWRKREEDNQ